MTVLADSFGGTDQADDHGDEQTAPAVDTDTAVDEPPPAGAVKDDGSPVTAADWAGMQEALRKARRDAREAKRGKGEQAAGDAPDTDQLRADTEQAAAGKWKPMVVKAHARSAFTEAGLVLPKDGADAAMNRVLRLLDLDDLDVTDDGQVDGLHEQVEDIRRDFPELFATATRRVPRVDTADKRDAPRTKSPAERLAAQITGGR